MIVVLMGVTGSGKTTIGAMLAHQLGWRFSDADDLHSEQNKRKIRDGIPLDDGDRQPWLAAITESIFKWIAANESVVLACSALKLEYRRQFEVGPEVKLVYLKGSYDLILQRLRSRQGHFATESILASQFATLEEPRDAVIVDIAKSAEGIVEDIRGKLHLGSDGSHA